jgi:Na+/phosphate symporter
MSAPTASGIINWFNTGFYASILVLPGVMSLVPKASDAAAWLIVYYYWGNALIFMFFQFWLAIIGWPVSPKGTRLRKHAILNFLLFFIFFPLWFLLSAFMWGYFVSPDEQFPSPLEMLMR